MSFFKKKITLSQLIADSISDSLNFYISNSDNLIQMSDELKVLEKKDIDELKELGYSLIIADLYISCVVNFNNKISNEEIGRAFGFLYPKFLIDVKHLSEQDVENKMNTFLKLMDLLESKEEVNEKDFENANDRLKFTLCSSFSKLYSGGNLQEKKVQGKDFAAFKLAKAIVKVDFVGVMLKDFKVTIK